MILDNAWALLDNQLEEFVDEFLLKFDRIRGHQLLLDHVDQILGDLSISHELKSLTQIFGSLTIKEYSDFLMAFVNKTTGEQQVLSQGVHEFIEVVELIILRKVRGEV